MKLDLVANINHPGPIYCGIHLNTYPYQCYIKREQRYPSISNCTHQIRDGGCTYQVDVVGIASAFARADHGREPAEALSRCCARGHRRKGLFDCLQNRVMQRCKEYHSFRGRALLLPTMSTHQRADCLTAYISTTNSAERASFTYCIRCTRRRHQMQRYCSCLVRST